MSALGRYKITQPLETKSVDDQNRIVYNTSIGAIDEHTGQVVRGFEATDSSGVRAGLQAADRMLGWLKSTPQ